MADSIVTQVALELWSAALSSSSVALVSARHPSFTLDNAYAVQRENRQRRLDSGWRLVGWKVGLTNEEAQRSLDVDRPIYGPVYDRTLVRTDAFRVDNRLVQRAEPEICFELVRDLAGPDVTPEQVVAATRALYPAIEMINLHLQGSPMTARDVVADAGAHAALVIPPGAGVSPAGLDLPSLRSTISRNGEVLATGTGADVLGHPARSVAFLARSLHQYGEGLRSGDLITSGTLGGAHEVKAGDVIRVEIDRLGTIELRAMD